MSISTIAQTTSTGITDSRNFLDNQANTLLRPATAEGISGFLFSVQNQETLTRSAEVTNHFTENNSFLNDHKTIQADVVTLNGFVGELVFEAPTGVAALGQIIQSRLEATEAYLGDLTPGAVQQAQEAISQAQSTVSAINQTLDKTQNVLGFFAGDSTQLTAQEKAFTDLSALFESKDLLTVQTPWKYYDNLTMTGLALTQDAETNQITDITVTLQEIRTTETTLVDFDDTLFPVREQVQSGAEQDQGIIQGQEEDIGPLLAGFRAVTQ